MPKLSKSVVGVDVDLAEVPKLSKSVVGVDVNLAEVPKLIVTKVLEPLEFQSSKSVWTRCDVLGSSG